jgi:hypothetical protein
MNEPIIIQCGKRRSEIHGDVVKLLKGHPKQKKTGVWPDTTVHDGELRMYAALAWACKGHIELPGLK